MGRRSAGDPLQGADQVQDAAIGDAVQDGAAVTAAGDDAGRPQDSEVLAHVRHMAPDASGQVPDGSLTAIGEILEDPQPLRVRQGAGQGGRAVAPCIGRQRSGDHEGDGNSICAIAQVLTRPTVLQFATGEVSRGAPTLLA